MGLMSGEGREKHQIIKHVLGVGSAVATLQRTSPAMWRSLEFSPRETGSP